MSVRECVCVSVCVSVCVCECVSSCSHRESDFDGMDCKSPSVKAFIRIYRMLRLCVCDPTKDSLAVPGFEFGSRCTRGVTDVLVRLLAVFFVESSFLDQAPCRMLRRCVCDPNKDSLTMPGFEFGPRRTRGVTDVSVRLPSVFLFEPSAVPGLEIDIPAVFLFESSLLGRATD